MWCEHLIRTMSSEVVPGIASPTDNAIITFLYTFKPALLYMNYPRTDKTVNGEKPVRTLFSPLPQPHCTRMHWRHTSIELLWN